jgi:hypothetical protein
MLHARACVPICINGGRGGCVRAPRGARVSAKGSFRYPLLTAEYRANEASESVALTAASASAADAEDSNRVGGNILVGGQIVMGPELH